MWQMWWLLGRWEEECCCSAAGCSWWWSCLIIFSQWRRVTIPGRGSAVMSAGTAVENCSGLQSPVIMTSWTHSNDITSTTQWILSSSLNTSGPWRRRSSDCTLDTITSTAMQHCRLSSHHRWVIPHLCWQGRHQSVIYVKLGRYYQVLGEKEQQKLIVTLTLCWPWKRNFSSCSTVYQPQN